MHGPDISCWRRMLLNGGNTKYGIVSIRVRVTERDKLVRAALSAGKHVYCEFLLGLTTKEAVDLLQMVEEKGDLSHYRASSLGESYSELCQGSHFKWLCWESSIGKFKLFTFPF